MPSYLAPPTILLLLTMFLGATAPAWSDNGTAPAGTRFSYGRQGDIVYDKTVRAIWFRCAYGQNWASNACVGIPHRTNGMDLEKVLAEAKMRGWELPTKVQLAALYQARAQIPMIDPVAFPETPPGSFWTVEAYTQWKNNLPTAFSMIDFSAGQAQESRMPPGTGFYLRLILNPGSEVARAAGVGAQ